MFKRASLIHAALGVVLALTPSCFYKEDLNYCPGNLHNNCLNTGSMTCKDSMECSGSTPVCDTGGKNVCVQCTRTSKSECQGATPACDEITNTCQPCTAHDQCDSKVCLMDLDGTCANPSDIAYVQSGGTGTMCTFDMPCGTLATAVGTSKAYIKFAAGVVKDTATTTIQGKTVTILADPGSALSRNGVGAILEVRDANTDVSIYDLRITGAMGGNDSAIRLEPAVATTSLSLTRVTVDQNQGLGISSKGGVLTISRSTFAENQAGGISIGGTQGIFDIINTFIVRNGTDVSAVGGVNITVVAAGSSRFEFNTIVDNRAAMGNSRSGGLYCDTPLFTAPNNLIARNYAGGSTADPNAQKGGVCMSPTSIIQSDIMGLNFVSPDMRPYSYKLSEGSSAIEQATTASTVMIDHDGDTRPQPQSGQKDIGADEFRQ